MIFGKSYFLRVGNRKASYYLENQLQGGGTKLTSDSPKRIVTTVLYIVVTICLGESDVI